MRHRVLTVWLVPTAVVLIWSAAGPAGATGEPLAPTDVTAVAGDAAATVSWAPAPGTDPTTSFTAVALPGGASCTSTATSCAVTGLINGISYQFSVIADSPAGRSPAGSTSAVVVPVAAAPLPTVAAEVTDPAVGGLFSGAMDDFVSMAGWVLVALSGALVLAAAATGASRRRERIDAGAELEFLDWQPDVPVQPTAVRLPPVRTGARPQPARTHAGRTQPGRTQTGRSQPVRSQPVRAGRTATAAPKARSTAERRAQLSR